MKCRDCIYYKSGYMENECLAFGWYCFRDAGDCEHVDENFNLLLDDMGNSEFVKREKFFEILKNHKYWPVDLNKRYQNILDWRNENVNKTTMQGR